MTIHNITKLVKPTMLKLFQDLIQCKKVVILYNEWDNKFGFMSDVKCTDVEISDKIHKIMRCKLGDMLISDLIQCPVLDVPKLVDLKRKGINIIDLI